MATHSSILAWRIPWTEELGRMAMGLQRDTIEVTLLVMVLDFPDVSVVKNPPANAGGSGDGFDPCVRKIPWRRKWQPTPVFLPEESHGQRSLVGYSPWGHKEQTQLSTHTCFVITTLYLTYSLVFFPHLQPSCVHHRTEC